jgi:hypothetical protein
VEVAWVLVRSYIIVDRDYEYLSVHLVITSVKIHDSSVGIVLGYGLDDRDFWVRFPAGTGNFSLHHRVQNGSGVHPTSYPMGTVGSFSGSKAAEE